MIAKTDYRQILTKPPGQAENRYAKIAGLLTGYEPISLAELNRSALLNRVDTKYIMHFEKLSQVLESLSGSYRLLDTNHDRPNHYRTLYFDTEQFTLYQQHHNHMRNRYKVRCREYVDTQVSFLEIKKRPTKTAPSNTGCRYLEYKPALTHRCRLSSRCITQATHFHYNPAYGMSSTASPWSANSVPKG